MTETAKQKFYLSVDCGGSNCRTQLYDASGGLLAIGRAGPANAFLGLDTVLSETFRATREAIDTLPDLTIPLSSIHAGIALAGLVEETLRTEFIDMPHPFASMTAETDAFVAQLGAFSGGDGGLLITGTGSCAFATHKGEKFYIGGWGFHISDQGSGARLGQLSLRRALQAMDGIQPASPFCDAVTAEIGDTPGEISYWAQQARPADYGRFSGLAFTHAEGGDPVALDLVRQIGGEVDQLISALMDRGVPQVCHVGGLAKVLRPWLDPGLLAQLVEPEGDVFEGAQRLIRDGGGLVNRSKGSTT